MLTSTRTNRLVAMAAVAALLLVGCGSDGDDEMSSQERYCQAGDDVRTAVSDLTNLDVLATGTDGLTAAVDEVGGALDELKDSADEASSDSVSALEEAVGEAEDTLSDLGDDLSAENAGSVVTAFGNVASAAEAVYATLTDC